MTLNLNKAISSKYYFVQDDVIFNISSSNPSNDDCAVYISKDKNADIVPKLVVTYKQKSTPDTYYFDNHIEDGDKLVSKTTFKKVSHIPTMEHGKEYSSFFEYYTDVCKYVISNSITSNYSRTYEYINENKNVLGIPMWMFKDEDITLEYNGTKVEGIDFTEELYNELKDTMVKHLIREAAEKTAMKYEYEVKTLEAQKKSGN